MCVHGQGGVGEEVGGGVMREGWGFLGRESKERRHGGQKLPEYLGDYKGVISPVTAEDGVRVKEEEPQV